MAWTLRGNHYHVDVGGRNNGFEMNAEAVREAENFALGEAGFDSGVIECRLGLVRGKNLDPVGAVGCLGRREHREPVCLGLLGAGAGGVEADDHVVAAVAEILGLGVSLAAVAEDGDSFALEGRWVGVALVKDSSHWVSPGSMSAGFVDKCCCAAKPTGRSAVMEMLLSRGWKVKHEVLLAPIEVLDNQVPGSRENPVG